MEVDHSNARGTVGNGNTSASLSEWDIRKYATDGQSPQARRQKIRIERVKHSSEFLMRETLKNHFELMRLRHQGNGSQASEERTDDLDAFWTEAVSLRNVLRESLEIIAPSNANDAGSIAGDSSPATPLAALRDCSDAVAALLSVTFDLHNKVEESSSLRRCTDVTEAATGTESQVEPTSNGNEARPIEQLTAANEAAGQQQRAAETALQQHSTSRQPMSDFNVQCEPSPFELAESSTQTDACGEELPAQTALSSSLALQQQAAIDCRNVFEAYAALEEELWKFHAEAEWNAAVSLIHEKSVPIAATEQLPAQGSLNGAKEVVTGSDAALKESLAARDVALKEALAARDAALNDAAASKTLLAESKNDSAALRHSIEQLTTQWKKKAEVHHENEGKLQHQYELAIGQLRNEKEKMAIDLHDVSRDLDRYKVAFLLAAEELRLAQTIMKAQAGAQILCAKKAIVGAQGALEQSRSSIENAEVALGL